MTTIETLTVSQIETLLNEAAQAGDYDMVSTCQRARGAVDDSATPSERRRIIAEARATVVDAIRNAEAQSDAL